MADKKIQENPLPEASETESDKPKDTIPPPKLSSDKNTPAVKVVPTTPSVVAPSPRLTLLGFTKMEPNELYRRLLPAVLFVLTFVTVMTMLLIYMDTVALGAQQFRVNMSRDTELARISQASAPLVAYVRQLHLAPRPPRAPRPDPEITPQVEVIDRALGQLYNGTFVEFLPAGGRAPSTLYLEAARAWDGVVVRAAARDYLALRNTARAAHACLSTTPHPREVSYAEGASEEAVFRSRVLCLPLYTLLLAAEATRAHYVLLAAPHALPALAHVPYHLVHLKIIEIRSTDPAYRNKTTEFLATKNYTVTATFEESIMYLLNNTAA